MSELVNKPIGQYGQWVNKSIGYQIRESTTLLNSGIINKHLYYITNDCLFKFLLLKVVWRPVCYSFGQCSTPELNFIRMYLFKISGSRFLLAMLMMSTLPYAYGQAVVGKKYVNEKYNFSFSFPSEYVLENTSDNDWQIHDAASAWGMGFIIFNLNGADYETHIKKISNEIISANGLVSRPPTANDYPQLKMLRECKIPGFKLDIITYPLLGSGNSKLEQMASAPMLVMNVLKKTSNAGFAGDGIMVYYFSLIFDSDKISDQPKSVLKSFEETLQFAKVENTKPVGVASKPNPAVPVTGSVVTPAGYNKSLVKGKFRDPREGGETYHTIKIDNDVWMSENLNESRFSNGELIQEAKTKEEWEKAGEERRPVWCYYNYDEKNDDYGKLYNWYAVNSIHGLAPAGWHIPTDAEWTKLIDFLGKDNNAAIKMKSIEAWETKNMGSNESGFEALPSGYCIFNGECSELGRFATWWTVTGITGQETARYISLFRREDPVKWTVFVSQINMKSGFSVRCKKN